MIAPRSVIVSIRSAAGCRAAMEAGVELARLFGAPVRGLFVEDKSLGDLCDLPTAFLPATIHRVARNAHRRAMAAALVQEIRQVRAEMERAAARASVKARVSVQSDTEPEAAEPEDLIVVSVDLSERPLAPAVATAAARCPPSGGVLLVPERRPRRPGMVVALVRDAADRATAVAAQIAAGLGVDVTYALAKPSEEASAAIIRRATETMGRAHGIRLSDLPVGDRLDARPFAPMPVGLVVAAVADLDRIDLDGPDALLRRHRAPLLLLADSAEA